MLLFYFPREEDTRDLKILIKKGIFTYIGKKNNFRSFSVCVKGIKEDIRNYGYNYNYEHFTFDLYNIYKNGAKISLTNLLEGVVFQQEKLTDEIKNILKKRNLDFKSISIGYTEPIFNEWESFASEDHEFQCYEIIKK